MDRHFGNGPAGSGRGQLRNETAHLQKKKAAAAGAHAAEFANVGLEHAHDARTGPPDPGHDPRITLAEERLQASAASLNVYTSIVARDERRAVGLVAVWISFGFAAAFALRAGSH